MKTFKKLFSEVAEPKAGEEKAFKDQHTIQKFDYPVQGSDAIFKGTVERKPRLADQDGDANYDKAYAQTSGDITLTGTQRESVELDEEVHTVDIDHMGGHDANAKKHNISLAHHKHGAYAVGKKKDLQKYLVKHYDDHDDAKANHPEVFKESVEQIDEISKDMTDRYMKKAMPQYKRAQTKQHVGGYGSTTQKGADANKERLRKRHKGIGSVHKRQGGSEVVDRNPARNSMTGKKAPYQHESVEQIDEISKDLAGRYIKKAQIDTADAADKVARSYDAYDKKKGEKDRKAGISRIVNRRMGTADAVRKLTGKARVAATEAYDDSPASPDEASMAKKQAEFIQYVAREIGMHIENGKEFPEWMQNKLSALHQSAKDYHSHLGAHGMDEEVELEEKKLTAKQMKQALAGMKVKGKDEVSLKKAPWEKDKNEALVGGQKKLDHNKNGKIDAHDFKMMRAKKKNEELEETTLSATKKMVNVTGPDGKVHTVQKRTKVKRTDDHGQDVMGEAYKQGSIRLKDGKTVKLSNEDADTLNTMMKGLNSSNRRKMEQTMMQSQKGFNEILSFAKTVS